MAPIIKDNKFVGSDKGLQTPVRVPASGAYSFKIANWDRADPPGYKRDNYPRAERFNGNVLALLAKPEMPSIKVTCQIGGGDASSLRLLWRLQTSYNVGRYEKINHDRDSPEYSAIDDFHEDTWTGEAHAADFTLFSDDDNVTYDNFTGRVSGGHCILTVAWQPVPAGDWLQDFVHFRIVGTNPTETDVRLHDSAALAARDPNLLLAANAVFAWEAGFKQFDPAYRTQERYHGVLFTWPPDPANFPVAAFDFGIGISQYTHWGQETNAICWDWRDNIDFGINELLSDFANSYRRGSTWIAWARRAWGRYNGGDPDGTGPYADRLAKSADGQRIATRPVPDGFNVRVQTAPIPLTPSPPKARQWPVQPPTPVIAVSLLSVDEHIASLRTITTDASYVPKLVELGSSAETIREVQKLAAAAMETAGHGYTLHNACAITLSEFFIKAEVPSFPKIFGAGKLAAYLEKQRNWKRIAVGQQRPGDVAVAEDNTPPSGADHIYLVVKCIDNDEMIIADNQKPDGHKRSARGRDGKTPVAYFLRAVALDDLFVALRLDPAQADAADLYPDADEDSNSLAEPFLAETP